jgi:hypothetical protein
MSTLVDTLDAAKSIVPPDCYLGWAIPTSDDPDEQRASTADILAHLRHEIALRGDRAQAGDLPDDDGPYGVIELLHLPTNTTLYRAVALDALTEMSAGDVAALVEDALGELNGRRAP